MAGYFFPDTNHEETSSINNFCDRLQSLKEAGVSVIFLEFFYEEVPVSLEQLREDFSYCSGGRNAMFAHYIKIVEIARKLDMEIVGLSLAGYYSLSRNQPETSLVYRLMGPFDGIATCIINRRAIGKSYAVFLGSGHWPVLKCFIPTLNPLVDIAEELVDPKTIDPTNEQLPLAQALANRWSRDRFLNLVIGLKPRHWQVIDGILRDRDSTDDVESLMVKWQDKAGVPINVIQLNYMLAKMRFIAPKMPVLKLRAS